MEKKQIEMTMGEAEMFLRHPGLDKFMKRDDRKLFKLRYFVTKVKNKLTSEMRAFQTSKDELIQKYCEKKDGKPVMIGQNQVKMDPKFNEEIQAQLNEIMKDKIILPPGYEYIVDNFEKDEEKFGGLTGDELEMLLMLTEE